VKQNIFLIIAALIAVFAGMAFKKWHIEQQVAKQPMIKMLDFSLPDTQGVQHHISEWQGKILIINFWATWCPPCLKEIPEFINLQTELSTSNVQFIGIAIEDLEPVQQYLAKTPVNYPILIGGDAAISLSRQLGNIVNAVPFTLIVNPQGQVIHRHPGELSRKKLLEIIAPLLANTD